MASPRKVVITGLGVVSPIGIGRTPFWDALASGRSGVRVLEQFAGGVEPTPIGGKVLDFDPKEYVTPRKSLKVMSREIQFAFGAAQLAMADAHLKTGQVEPERFGVVFGADMLYADPLELEDAYRRCMRSGEFDFATWGEHALGEMFPLWMLKYLPNMPACHIAIAQDARGPNNSIVCGEASSLLALIEAARVIERGQADVMVSGGTGCRIDPMVWVFLDGRWLSKRRDQPTSAVRPFDATRDGMCYGEGSAAFVLEEAGHAAARGRRPLAEFLAGASAYEPARPNTPPRGIAIRATIRQTLKAAGLEPAALAHVNANGLATVPHDWAEAQAIHELLGDVPVVGLKGFFGNLGAATGAVEMAGSLVAMEQDQVPFTLNYERPDPACPVNVVHRSPQPARGSAALLLNQTTSGQAVAALIGRPSQD